MTAVHPAPTDTNTTDINALAREEITRYLRAELDLRDREHHQALARHDPEDAEDAAIALRQLREDHQAWLTDGRLSPRHATAALVAAECHTLRQRHRAERDPAHRHAHQDARTRLAALRTWLRNQGYDTTGFPKR